MLDVAMIMLLVVGFAAAWAWVRACAQVTTPGTHGQDMPR